MKNKIKLFISIFIILQFIFSIKSIANESSTNPNYTNEQIAIQDVAYAFYYRGESLQYDDYSMTDNTAKYDDGTIITRKRRSQYTHYPEEATPQDIQYTVCSEYVANVFYEAFSDGKGNPYEIKSTKGNIAWQSDSMVKLADSSNSAWYNPNLAVFYAKGTDGEIASKKEEYKELLEQKLEPGDVIAYRSSGNWGHVLLYLGEDIIINASSISNKLRGGSYNYTKKQDVLDKKGTVGIVSLKDDVLNYTDQFSKYIFSNDIICLAVLRPLNEIKSNPTQESDFRISDKTLKRMEHSKLVRTKTASIDKYDNISIRDEISYYITIENKSETEDYENIVITDAIPKNTELISLTEQGKNENGQLIWNVNLPKGEKKIISYTVKVKDDKSLLGKTIVSDSCIVDGLKLNKIETFINNKLIDTEAFREDASNLVGKEFQNTSAMLNNIYPQFTFPEAEEALAIFYDNKKVTAFGTAYGHKNENGERQAYILKNKENIDNSKKELSDMYVDGLFGGVYTITEKEPVTIDGRNTNYTFSTFSVGDIVVLYDDDYQTDSFVVGEKNMYLYIGENNFITVKDGKVILLDDTTSEKVVDSLIGQNCFIVLRPSNADKETPELNVYYSSTEKTKENVLITITSNEKILEVEGWNLSEDKKTLTKTYVENKDEQIEIYDIFGNKRNIEIKIENIDKEKPVLDVTCSTTKATNQDVVVTINSNEEIKSVSGWTLSEDKKTLTKTYMENKTENIEITDIAGNTSTAVIDIKNIDKEKPVLDVKYSSTEQTLNDVIVTIEANEELQEIEGWQLSDDKKILTKTYTKNGEETITIYDLAGNSRVELIKVENIDKEKPQYEVKYSTTISTNEDVIVTITANQEIQSIEGWALSEDKKVLTKKYTENTEEEIIIKDIVGNSANKTIIKINNIDKIKPELNISYSITELTNQDIIVTITANEEIKEIEGWNLSTDKKELKKKFTSNTEENITISDLAGNTISDTIKIGNIDKVTPKIAVKYSTTSVTDKDVIVTITSDKIIKSIDSWTLSSDKKQLTKTFNENGEEKITITDEAGNSVTTNIKVSNIDKTKAKQANTKVNSNNDTTTAKMILPNTGEKNILVFIAVFMIISTIMYIKFKKYKDVK